MPTKTLAALSGALCLFASVSPALAQDVYPSCADDTRVHFVAFLSVVETIAPCADELNKTGGPHYRCRTYLDRRALAIETEMCWSASYEYFGRAEQEVAGYKTPPAIAEFIQQGARYMKQVTEFDALLAMYP